jgi:hypothetical protein
LPGRSRRHAGRYRRDPLVCLCSGVEPLPNGAVERVRAAGAVVMIALYENPVTLNVNSVV